MADALRVIIPNAEVRKEPEHREWERKSGARAGELVREVNVAVDDSAGNRHVVTFEPGTKLPSRGDVIDLEADLTTFSSRDSFAVSLRLAAVTWRKQD